MAIYSVSETSADVLEGLIAQLQAARIDPMVSRGRFLTMVSKALHDAYRLGWDERQSQLEAEYESQVQAKSG